jgi:calcineurin-like phosphoesterase family protein
MILDPTRQRIGFTADAHAYHHNVIKYSNRPFKNVMEMNEEIRDRHNSMFDKDDIVFNLGDALLLPRRKNSNEITPELKAEVENWLKSFNGKIFYIPGNHESHIDIIRKHWKIVPQLYEVTIEDDDAHKGRQSIVMCHFAMRNWSKAHYGAIHLFAHSHGSQTSDTGENMRDYKYSLSMDVGVDTNNYYPYTYEDVKKHMATKIFTPLDHHTGGETVNS